MTDSTPPADAAASSPTPAAPRRQRRWLRRLVIALGALLVLLLLLVLLTPALLSTGPGTRLLSSLVNKQIPGTVRIDGLSLGWFTGQHVTGLVVRDPSGGVVLDAAQIDAPDFTLWSAVRGRRAIGPVKITNRQFRYVDYGDGTSNLTKALGLTQKNEPSTEPAKAPADLKLALELSGGTVEFSSPQADKVTASDLSASVSIADVSHIKAAAKAKVQQDGPGASGEMGGFEVSADLNDLFDAQGVMRQDALKLDAKADLANLPVAAIDVLAGQNGKLVKLLGPKLTGSVTAKGTLTELQATLNARSEHLTANLGVQRSQHVIALSPDAKVTLRIVPEAWTAWTATADKPGQAPAKLLQAFMVTLDVKRLSAALKDDGGLDLSALDAMAALDIGDVVLDAGPGIGTIALRQTRGTLSADGKARTLAASFTADGEQAGNTGKITLAATVANAFDERGRFDQRHLRATVQGGVRDFPLAVADQIAGLKGLLGKVLGDTLAADLTADVKPAEQGAGVTGTFALTARALRGANKTLDGRLSGALTERAATLERGSQVVLVIEPTAIAELARRFGDTSPFVKALKLHQATTATVSIDALQVALPQATIPAAATPAKTPAKTPPSQPLLPQVTAQARLALGRMTLSSESALPATTLQGAAANVVFDGAAKRLAVAAALKPEAQGKTGDIALTADLTNVLNGQGEFSLAGATGKVTGKITDLPMALVEQFAKTNGLLARAVGPAVSLDLGADLGPTPGSNFPGANFVVTARAANLEAKLVGEGSARSLVLAQGSFVRSTLDAALVEALKKDNPELAAALGKLNLAAPATATVQVTSLSMPLEGFDLTKVKAGVRATIDALALTGDERFKDVALRDVVVTLPDAALSGPVKLTVDGTMSYQAQPGKLHAELALANLADELAARPAGAAKKPRNLNAAARLEGAPVALVDVLANQRGLLTAVLGPTLSTVDVSAATDPADPADARKLALAAKVTSERLTVDLAGHYAEGSGLALKQNGFAELVLTPAALDYVLRQQNDETGKPKQPEIALTAPAKFRLALQQPVEVGFQPKPADPGIAGGTMALAAGRTRFAVTLTSDAAVFKRLADGQVIPIRNLAVTTSSTDLSKALDLTVSADVELPATAAQPAQTGRLVSANRVTNLVNAKGELDFAHALIATDTKAPALPVDVVDALLNQQGQLIAMLGHKASLAAKGDLALARAAAPDGGLTVSRGQMAIALDSENAKASIPATIQNGRVDIRGGTASLRLTRELSGKYLSTKNPLLMLLSLGNPVLMSVESSDKPVHVTINQFSAPLADFDLKKATGDVQMELGTLTMRTNPLTGLLVSGLRAAGVGLQSREQFPATFTPLKVTIKDGVATSNDLWFSTGDFIMGSQVRVRMVGEDPAAWPCDLLIAIPGDTMQLIRPIARRVKTESIFEVPARGPLGEINNKIEYGKLFAQVGKMALEANLGSRLGNIGALVSGGLNLLDEGFGAGKTKGWEGAQWLNRPKPMAREVPAEAPAPTPGVTPRPAQPGAAPPRTQPAPPPQGDPIKGLFDLIDKAKDKSKDKKK